MVEEHNLVNDDLISMDDSKDAVFPRQESIIRDTNKLRQISGFDKVPLTV